ncbi:hypothetical protein F443_13552, partial [Phytophthora nicotianae P1569]
LDYGNSSEKALEHDKAFQRHKRDKRERSDGDSTSHSSSRPSQSAKKTSFGNATRLVSAEPPAKTSTERPKVPPKPCPHCDGMHWLSECPKATDEEKSEIRRKLRAQRSNGSKKDGARLKRLRECIPSEEKTVTLNDVIELPYCADTGADRTAISRSHVDEMQQRDPSVNLITLKNPVVNVAVGKWEITCTTSVHLRVLLNTAAGPVALHKPVECLVIEDDEPEFILGQDLLKALGIDIDRQLEQLVIRDTDEEEDLVDLDEMLPGAGPDPTGSDLHNAIEKLIRTALDHGFPHLLAPRLRAIVLKHDIWRLELGNDPPAKVEPLKIRLKDGAKAVKSKPRQYPPAVRKFLKEFKREACGTWLGL